jgi:CHAD domain-containing protein
VFLDDAEAHGPWVNRSVRAFADLTLWTTYRKILKHGRVIDSNSPDGALHDLRKRAKKFRYLLEFFQSLYPVKSMKIAIAELKQFQDHLGRFQDCCVQMQTLQSLRRGDIGEVATGAIDQLLADLAQQHRQSRAAFGERFARFDAKPNRVRYAALFKPARRGD